MRRLASFLVLVLVAGCSDAITLDVTDEQLRPTIVTWVVQTGLIEDDPEVWRVRLGEACAQGVWDEDVAVQLADRYVTEDLSTAMEGVEDGPDLRHRAAQALWIMAVQVCSEDFPEGEIEEGPPGT